MHSGRFVFAQVMDHLPMKAFHRCVQRYQGNRHVQSFTCLDQFLCMAFAQLTFRESLRDIEACLRAHQDKLYHMGIRGGMSRNTLANANQRRDWRIYAEFAQAMIRIARPLYADEDLGLELDNTVYALDASTIDLCLSVFPWALFRSTKSAVKLHTLLDLRGNIPTFIHVSDGKMHDVNVLDILVPEPGAFYIMDRGYVDFERLFLLHTVGAFFIIRAKSNTRYERRHSHPVDKTTGVRCDQTVVLTGAKGKKRYPQPVQYYDPNTQTGPISVRRKPSRHDGELHAQRVSLLVGLDGGDKGRLAAVRATTAFAAASLATEIGIVDSWIDPPSGWCARSRSIITCISLWSHAPRRVVGDAQMAVQLHRRDAFLSWVMR